MRAAGRPGSPGRTPRLSARRRPASPPGSSDEIVDMFDPATFLSSTANADRQEPPRRASSSRRAVAIAAWLESRGQLHLARRRRAARRRRRRWSARCAGRATAPIWSPGAKRAASAGARASLMSASGGTRISTCSRPRRVIARRLCAGLGQSRLSASCRSSKLYRAGGKRLRRRLSGRGRLQHAGTDGLCGSSRRFWRLASRSPRRRRSRAAARGVAQPVHRRAAAAARRAGADRVGHPSRAAAGGDAACGGRRGAIRATTAACSRSLALRPDLVVTMGGGGARPAADRRGGSASGSLDLPFAAEPGRRRGSRSRRLAAALGRPRGGRGAAPADRRAEARAGPAARRRRDLARRRRAHRRRRRASRRNGWRWRACGSGRCRATGCRSRRCSSARRRCCCAATIAQGQYSSEQRWLTHPLARRAAARRTLATDGRRWTCMGPLLIDEIERLRGSARRDEGAARSLAARAGRRSRPRLAAAALAPLAALLERGSALAARCSSSCGCRAPCSRSPMERRSARRAPRSRPCSPIRSPRPTSPARPAARRWARWSPPICSASRRRSRSSLGAVGRRARRARACCSRWPGRGRRPRPCCSPASRSARWPGR